MVKRMSHEWEEVRKEALSALGLLAPIGDERYLEMARNSLQDHSERVRCVAQWVASSALVSHERILQLDTHAANTRLLLQRERSCEIRGRPPELLLFLFSDAERAADTLCDVTLVGSATEKNTSVKSLAALLTDTKSAGVRETGVRSLCELGLRNSETALEALKEACKSTDYFVRRDGVAAIPRLFDRGDTLSVV